MRGLVPIARRAAVSMIAAGSKPANEVQCTVALVKNIVGTGVLALPAGIARLSDGGAVSSDAFVLAAVLVVAFGALNGLGFMLIGEACAATSQRSYVGAWRKTIGQGTSFIPALTSLFLCFLAAVACASVVGDVGTDVLCGLIGKNYEEINRNSVLAALSAGIFTPLCLLPSLAPLGTASVLGVIGVVITGGAMTVRLLDGSYAPAGAFAADVVASPSFHEAVGGASAHLTDLPPSAGATCFFLSLVSNAYLAHYNAPSVYNECRNAAALTAQQAGLAEAVEVAVEGAVGSEVGGDVDSEVGGDVLSRLTSALAAEEVNSQFQAYIESVPSFGVEGAYTAGYTAGYQEGFAAGYRAANEALAAETATRPSEGTIAASMATVADAAAADGRGVDASVGIAPFRRVVVGAFGISSALFVLIAWAGFSTFGDASDVRRVLHTAATHAARGTHPRFITFVT